MMLLLAGGFGEPWRRSDARTRRRTEFLPRPGCVAGKYEPPVGRREGSFRSSSSCPDAGKSASRHTPAAVEHVQAQLLVESRQIDLRRSTVAGDGQRPF